MLVTVLRGLRRGELQTAFFFSWWSLHYVCGWLLMQQIVSCGRTQQPQKNRLADLHVTNSPRELGRCPDVARLPSFLRYLKSGILSNYCASDPRC